jgi:hypothetical protein
MGGHHSIRVVPERALIRLTMGGFYLPEEVPQLARDMALAVAALGCGPHEHVTLCDIRTMAIQSQKAVEAFMGLVGSEGVRSRKLAFITSRSLARMQARRLTSRPDVEFFDDIPAAEAWLGVSDAGDGVPPAARLLAAVP